MGQAWGVPVLAPHGILFSRLSLTRAVEEQFSPLIYRKHNGRKTNLAGRSHIEIFSGGANF